MNDYNYYDMNKGYKGDCIVFENVHFTDITKKIEECKYQKIFMKICVIFLHLCKNWYIHNINIYIVEYFSSVYELHARVIKFCPKYFWSKVNIKKIIFSIL